MILILAQTVSPPAATPAPDEGPPPPSIVERVGAPPAPSPYPTPLPSPSPTSRTAAPPTPLPKIVPVAAPAPAALLPKAGPVAAPAPPAAAAPAAASRASAASAFGVHVSSFRKRATAESEARRLGAELALPARVLQVNLGAKGVWHRVVVGEAGTAAEASALREQLKKKGIPDGVVQNFPR